MAGAARRSAYSPRRRRCVHAATTCTYTRQRARAAVLPLSPSAMTLSLVLLYKALLEESARHQRNDTARKLAAHRVAWATMASARAAGAAAPGAERDAGGPDATGPAPTPGATGAAEAAPPAPDASRPPA